MGENQLIGLFSPIIQATLTVDGFTDAVLMQDFQPMQQGFPSAPVVSFHHAGDVPRGAQHVDETYDTLSASMIRTTTQWHETTFEISTYAPQNPTNITTYTAADLGEEVRQIMQLTTTIDTMIASGVGILRIAEVPKILFNDDRDRFEPQSTFKIILTHLTTRTEVIPVISSTNPGLYPI